MSVPIKGENIIRRLFRDCEDRQPATDNAAAGDLADILGRLRWASTEMERLRGLVASQQGVIYDQRRDLAQARRALADALAETLRLEQLGEGETRRADAAAAELARMNADLAVVRSHFREVTAAVSHSFDRGQAVVPLREVA